MLASPRNYSKVAGSSATSKNYAVVAICLDRATATPAGSVLPVHQE